MIVLSGALVLVALVLLVFGALDRNLPYVYASIGVSVLSLLLLLVGILQRRGELAGDVQDDAATPVTDTSAERVPALVGAGQEQARAGEVGGGERTTELVTPVPAPAAAPVPASDEHPASRRVVPAAAPVEDAQEPQEGVELDDADQDFEDERPDDEPEHGELADEQDEGSGVTVLVVSGRPRYHLEGCRVLRGKEPQPLDRDDARTHGFSPCGVCKPDADETADQQQPGSVTPQTPGDDGLSFTESLFGESLFADPSDDDAGGVETGALPDRPVQPVPPDAEPAVVARGHSRPALEHVVPDEEVEPPAELRRDDPADDPTLETDHDPAAEPTPDVAADPDKVPDDPAVDAAGPEPVEQQPAVSEEPEPSGDAVGGEPVVEPVVADEVPVVEVPAEDVLAAEPLSADVPEPEVTADETAEAEPSRRGEAADRPATAAVRKAEARRRRAKTSAATSRAAETAPAEQAPAKKAAAKKASAKKASAKKAPAKKAPAKKAPAEADAQVAPSAAAVKRPLVRAVRADALRLGAPSSGGTTTRVAARGAAPATSAPVVVVPDRDRFHRQECRFVRGVAGATRLPKASAARQGYAACGVCKP